MPSRLKTGAKSASLNAPENILCSKDISIKDVYGLL